MHPGAKPNTDIQAFYEVPAHVGQYLGKALVVSTIPFHFVRLGIVDFEPIQALC